MTATVTRDEFEDVKELLASAARYAESANARLDRVAAQQELNTSAIALLGERQDRTQQQLDVLAIKLDRLGDRVDQLTERVDQLTERVDQLTERVDQLSTQVSELSITVESLAQQAVQDRSQAEIDRAEFRSTVTQLLEVLTQQFNGNGRSEG
ncbi:hypothetical protein H6F67_15960 [Microcoleus sp. FACHB-1515]|uniref:hypothetical protein n=1 Tax=Cyanophyceae TaxID=3028117 RepID=UPI00168955B0|nr:hypothetical protein [Microcoleus sp. FACHB-1515]MBD2091342.1 hypothetical protein [Microcoleus sp. FACHB-1515]